MQTDAPDIHRAQSLARMHLLHRVADRIPAASGDDCVRVGIDGVDGSGKSIFADELAAVVRGCGRAVVRISLDDFHNVRAVRYRRGRSSPEGFWLDSYNYARLRTDVLDPFGPGGSRCYRRVAHDLVTDAVLDPLPQEAPPGAVLILDGLFLHRDELASMWDLSVFLDVPFAVSVRRMVDRDGTSADPQHPSIQRYVEAQKRYFATCVPQQRAGLLIDNSVIEAPRLLNVQQRRSRIE